MKIPALLTLLLAALLAALPTRQARAEDVSFDVFYNNLADDGDWYNTPDFGYVWHPAIADDANWRPYTDGYWAQTDDGWTWVSYESFGWATYHYGRWTRLKDIGWAWTPGYQWGPGWVSWRTSDEYVGWAPLPPRPAHNGGASLTVDYNDVEAVDDGYTSAVDQDYDIGPDNYCFVATPQFGAPVLARVLLPPQRNVIILENTRNVTNIYYRRNSERTVVYNSGPDFAFISGRVERPIQRLRLEPREDVAYLRESGRGGGNPTVVRGGALVVASPVIARRPVNFEQVRPVRVKQTLAQPQVVHGWSNAGGDPQQVQRLREHFKEQAQAAPRQARADLPPQNVAPAAEAGGRPPGSTAGQEDADRVARRDAAVREKAARDRARNGGGNNPPAAASQPFANGQNTAPENRSGRNGEDREARRANREQAQQNPAVSGSNPPTSSAPDQDDRAAKRAARQGREERKQTTPNPGAASATQPDTQAAHQTEQPSSAHPDRDAHRAARQAQPQPSAAPSEQAEPARSDREARRATRQPQPQTEDTQPEQPQPARPDRETRRAERQPQPQPQPAQPQPAQPQSQPDREARRAERQQQQQQQQQAQPQPAQPPQAAQSQQQQERANRRAERQQQQPPSSPQPGNGDDDKKKHGN